MTSISLANLPDRAARASLLLLVSLLLSACGGGEDSRPAPSVDIAPPPGTVSAPQAVALAIDYVQIKRLRFTWDDTEGESSSRLFENTDGNSGFSPVATISANLTTYDRTVFLPARLGARYILEACNSAGCNGSNEVQVAPEPLLQAIGYLKASNTGVGDRFGWRIALSGDGTTLAVGAHFEDSSAIGIDAEQEDNSETSSGAVYVFAHTEGGWQQTAYIKADNNGTSERNFGIDVALSNTGNTLAVGAAKGNGAFQGAVYVFVRDDGGNWQQEARLMSSNIDDRDRFGSQVALSGSGDTLAVGTTVEASGTGDPRDNSAPNAGAVYVFTRDDNGAWIQEAYLKASNTGREDRFGWSLDLSDDGNTLAVGAPYEDSAASGVNGAQNNDTSPDSGAVYLFGRIGSVWSQRAYLKASNTGAEDRFGSALALSASGDRLAVGAPYEDSKAGLLLPETNDDAPDSGAVYFFLRDANGNWSQQAMVKASDGADEDNFGHALALSGDGVTLVVGAPRQDSSATAFAGTSLWNKTDSGAVYLFTRQSNTVWRQQPYLKASNSGTQDRFGNHLAISGDGSILAVGAWGEDSAATGIGGSQNDDSAQDSGAVYLY